MNNTKPVPWGPNKNCLHWNIKTHTEEWYKFRERGIGSSEISVVTRTNDFEILPRWIERKAGLRPDVDLNEAMLAGLYAEDGILDRWKYWDGGESYVLNYVAKKIIRDCIKFFGYVTNPKYPILFTSTDAWAMPGSPKLSVGEESETGFPIEAKLISGYYADKWEASIPPGYIFQIHHEMLVTESDYAELATLRDGKIFQVIPIERRENLCNMILEKSEEVWPMVLRVRDIASKIKIAPSSKEKDELQAELDSMLPLPDENPLYAEFYSEKHIKTSDFTEMPQTVYENAILRVKIAKAVKVLEDQMEYFDNMIKREFSLAGVEFFDAGVNDGKLRYYLRTGGKNHQLSYQSFKAKPKGEVLEQITEKTKNLIKEIIL